MKQMKKVLVLTACLLSGLMAASAGDKKIDEAEVQRVMTEIGRVTGEITGNERVAALIKSDEAFRNSVTSKNPHVVAEREAKIKDFKAQLKALEEQLDKLLPKQ